MLSNVPSAARAHHLWTGAVVGLFVLGCAANTPRIPVNADPQSMAGLAGAWAGEYSSIESGRSGTIVFDLSAGADTASGEVTMLSRQFATRRSTTDEPSGAQPQPIARTLSITFVQAASDLISGSLDPYEDPECGCTLLTVFSGQLKGDRIDGTYTSRKQPGSDLMAKGTWFVTRTAK